MTNCPLNAIMVKEQVTEIRKEMNMEAEKYLDYLTKIYEVYYDLFYNYKINPLEFDLYGRYFERNEKYFATKKIVLYGLERNEHLLYKHYKKVSLDDVKTFTHTLEDSINTLVTPGGDHMATLIRGLISTETRPDKEVIRYVKKYKFYKSFLFGMKGWVNIGLNLVNINDSTSYHNKMGKAGSESFLI
ncbi:MAG: hypothetical protein Q4P25_05255 [Tissierellia bacterium]|nr:hypothetical protein [Tissierellia bacterium]